MSLRKGIANASAPPLDCPCPPQGMVEVVGKKWALCVVTLLGKHGPLRFGLLQRSLPGVSPATLTSTLRQLSLEGIVTTVPVQRDRRARGSYGLTPKGLDLYRALLPFSRWLRS
jgi:DNA-binding HxlR family transcriptional regulator